MMHKVKLKEICTLLNGRAYKQEELLDFGKYPVLRVGNFYSDKDYYYSNMELEDNKYCYNGDLLFAWSASFGPKIWNGGKVIYHYHIWKMVLQNTVDKEYLYYYLVFLTERIKAEGHGGIMIHTTKAEMEERELLLPNIYKQKEIAKILNQLSEVIKKRQYELQKLDELIKARFVELFGDIVLNPIGHKESTVAEYCQMTQGTQIPMSEQISEYKEGYYRYLYIRDLKYEDENWIYVLDQYDEKKLTEDDLVVVNTGNTAGEIYRGKDGILSNNLFKVSFDTEILSTTYLYYYFGSDAFQKMLWSEMKEGTQPHLGHKIFGSKKLLVPPTAIQEQFSIFVKQVDKSKAAVQKALEETQTLFNSLMQEYFG